MMTNSAQKNSLRLIIGNITSRLGTSVFNYVNQITITNLFPQQMRFMSYYQASETVIQVAFNLLSGVLADRLNRKRLLILTDVLSGLVCLVGVPFLHSKEVFLLIMGANIVLKLLATFNSPVYSAMIKDSITEDVVDTHYSRSTMMKELFNIVSPAIGVLVMQWVGLTGAYLFNALTFFFSAFVESRIEILHAQESRAVKDVADVLKDMKAGLSYIRQQKEIFFLLVMSCLVNFVLAAYNLFTPYLNGYYEGQTANFFGGLLIASSIGSIAFSSLKNMLQKRIKTLYLYQAMLGCGLSLLLFPLLEQVTTLLWLKYVPFALFSGFLTLYNIEFFVNVQKRVDHAYIGRVMSVIFTVAVLFMPLGSLVFGYIHERYMMTMFTGMGLAIMVIALGAQMIAKKLKL